MPIDLSSVDWLYVVLLSFIAFVAALLGSLISFRNRFTGAIVAGILFGVAFVFWTYYPHPDIPGPTRLEATAATPAATSAAPAAAPSRPANPVTTLPAEPTNPATTSPPSKDAK